MSEVQSRTVVPRGRGSGRGGRGGFSSRGRSSRTHAINGNKPEIVTASIEEESEVGQLKKLYSSQVSMIKEMFPDWTDEDIVFALRETDGNLELTVERITDGTISQWGEVSKTKKDRSRSKVKDTAPSSQVESTISARVSRVGRAGLDNARGNRSGGAERSRGGKSRGASVAHTSGTRKSNNSISTPTDEWTTWDNPSHGDGSSMPSKPQDDIFDVSKPFDDSFRSSDATAPSTTTKAPSKITSDGVQKSWATLFAPTPAPKKKTTSEIERPTEPSKLEETRKSLPIESAEHVIKPILAEPIPVTPAEPDPVETAETEITTSKDDLTEDNLEQLPDASVPVSSVTVASTAASSWDPRGGANSTSPYNSSQNNPQQGNRTVSTGHPAPTIKGNVTSGRTPNYQRRVFDQEEAVRMPGNREVDRAAVQFGAFSLKGTGEEDVDEDREEAETRAQPPQHSPVAPRAALPPVHQQQTPVPENLPTPKQISGLPATPAPASAPGLPSPAPLTTVPTPSQQAPQANGHFNQYGRFAQNSAPEKPYDTFSHQAPSAQSPFEGYPNQQTQSQPQTTHSGTFSSAPNDYSSYYTTDPQHRNAYNSYYQQQYGSQHQGAQNTQNQDGSASQQRSYNGYNGPPGDNSQFPQSAIHQPQSRYVTASEGQNSGHTTPNPGSQAPQPGAAAQTGQPQAGQQPQVPGTYQYGHPYFSSPYYSAYMNQYPGYGTGNYPGGPYAAKSGIHQHYQGYNISPAPPYEHSASPGATAFGVSSLHGRDSTLGVLSDYGRAGSSQSTQTPQTIGASNTFGAGHDAFSRGSSYQGQGQPHYGSQQSIQQSGDDIKSFNDSKTTNGPNSSLQGRPGSATNTAAGSGSVLPPPQSQQAGYGSYPAHLQQPGHNLHGAHTAAQYGALSGAGGQHQASGQGHQNSQYGAYPGYGGNYYSNSQQQQRGGWGGNYGH